MAFNNSLFHHIPSSPHAQELHDPLTLNNSLFHHVPSSPHAQELHDSLPSHPKNEEEDTNELNGYLDNLIYTMQTYQMEYDIENVRF
jgi:hypothetical protein